MSKEKVEIVRRAIAVNRSGGVNDAMELFAEGLLDTDCEFVSRLSSIEGSAYRGREGFRRYFSDMKDAFKDWRSDVNETTVVAPNIVLVDITNRATSHSGIPVELQSFHVWVLSGCRVLRILAYPTRSEALEAAGLSE